MSRSDSPHDDGAAIWRFWGDDEASRIENYELARRKLITFFMSKRLNVEAEEMADSVFSCIEDDLRDGKVIDNQMAYCYGVAVNLIREHHRDEGRKRKYAVAMKHRATNGDFRRDQEDEEREVSTTQTWELKKKCFEKCKAEKFTHTERRLWDEFYKYSKGRRKIEHREMLAELLFKNEKAGLFAKMHKLRERIRRHIKLYIEKQDK